MTSPCVGWSASWPSGARALTIGWSGRSFTTRSSVTKKTLIASERNGPEVARRHPQWKAYQDRIDPTRLVFIDETRTKTNMAPLRGWGRRGQRLPAKVPHGRWTTMTFLAALRHDRVEAPWLIYDQ